MQLSESQAAVGDVGVDEDDCPLCMEPLPPFWDPGRRATYACCGKCICVDCHDKRNAFVNNAVENGSYGRLEEQLNRCCPFCRTPMIHTHDNAGRVLADKYEKGELPLNLYCMLGNRFIDGQGGVERDVQKAIEIFMLGAERGDPHCQFSVGAKYQTGMYGFSQSMSEAKRWYLRAAGQGHAKAEFQLAFLSHEEGNDAEYQKYLRRSASKGYNDACYNLGMAHYKGINGAQKISEEAIRVLTPAAERGHAKSMCLLGAIMCNQGDDCAYAPRQPSTVVADDDAAQMTDLLMRILPFYGKGDEPSDQVVVETIHRLPPHALEMQDVDGNTLLMLACQAGAFSLTALLLSKGCNANTRNNAGTSPLHYACFVDTFNADAAISLVRHGALAEVVETEFGCTPLHWAAVSGHTELCAALCRAGGNPCTLDKNGCDAIHYAKQNSHTTCSRLLESFVDQSGSASSPIAAGPAASPGDPSEGSACNQGDDYNPEPWSNPQDNPSWVKGMHWLQRAAEKGDQTAIAELRNLEKSASSKCFRCCTEAPPEKAFLQCSRCRAAWYCSKDCQVQHWRAEGGHKQRCIKWK